MRILSLLLLMFVSFGCSAAGADPPTPVLIDQTVAEALAAPSNEPISIVGYLVEDARGVTLTGAMSLAADPPTPLADAPTLWLGAEPPPTIALEPAGDRTFALVRVVGRLEGPGAFGPAGLAYRVQEPALSPLSPRAVRLTALLAAASTSENQVLRISGALLNAPGTNLLVENLGPGGVPEAASRQIKVLTPAADPALEAQLTSGGSVRYGSVEVIGIWRDGAIHALAIVPTTDD